MDYYNEIDSRCCAVLARHVETGELEPAHIDCRSITDITGEQLEPYQHIHLFAGIGGFGLGFKDIDIKGRVITGGFPCQDVSVAGKRAGLAGERSGLWFEFERIIGECKAEWVVIENVPGLLSSNSGRDFATVIHGLEKWGYGVAWRVLDAQYFGLAQRRRRVFIVGHLGDGRSAQVLFEREGLSGDPAESRKTRKGTSTYAVRQSQTGSNGWGVSEEVFGTLDVAQFWGVAFDARAGVVTGDVGSSLQATAGSHGSLNSQPLIAGVVSSKWAKGTGGYPDPSDGNGGGLIAFGGNNTSGAIDVATACNAHGGTGRHDFESETFIVFDEQQITSKANRSQGVVDQSHTLNQKGQMSVAQVAVNTNADGSAGNRIQVNADVSVTLQGMGGGEGAKTGLYLLQSGVRRLTPKECERLQGFPDGWTGDQSDSTRYKQLGNAVAVPVVRWVAQQIEKVEKGEW